MMYKLMIVCVTVALTLPHSDASKVSKRDRAGFVTMVACAAQYTVSLNGYGCWCGIGNNGRP